MHTRMPFILNTALPSISDDTITCWPDPQGTFTVKSTYKPVVNNLIDTTHLLVFSLDFGGTPSNK